ncbi:hypothetical protein BN1079_02784 [Pseudomonas saudiphocaensis]|uniref:Uncharacterized protein n=1 Tax=Pseudomonas saudiphocaensis TaxID=1499686 RepID=A0A078LW89_9PSED|nr:hypothetical protein BN1079_02784 [Pseudomonas saudiphocaensis]
MKVSLSWALAELLDGAGFALLGELLFSVAKKVTKNACPYMRPCAARRVRSLHRCFRGRLTRAVPGPLSLSPHPCGSLPYATIPLTLLKGAVGGAYWFDKKKISQAKTNDLPGDSDPVPVRRPSGGVAQGDARHGRRARSEGTGTSLRDGPQSGTGAREVWPQARPGCRGDLLFGYFLLARQKQRSEAE